MAYRSPRFGRRRVRGLARALLMCSLLMIEARSATVACLYDPNERPVKVLPPGPPPTPAMTTTQLADALRKARLPQAEIVAALPGVVEQSSFDFLNGGTYLKVTLERGFRSQVYHFVRKGGRLSPISPGREGRDKIVNDFDLSVRSPEAALRYVQWLLDVTSEGGFWLVQSVDDVPFLPVNQKDNKALREQIDASRGSVQDAIKPARAEASGTMFVVQQDAVTGRDLVRYSVKVSKLGLPTIEVTTLAKDLPVVNAG